MMDHPDAVSTIAAVTGATLCLECLARAVDASPELVWAVLAEVSGAVKIAEDLAVCDACLTPKNVFRIA